MAHGVTGTGPYSKLRMLNEQIKNCEFEISLIEEGRKKGDKTGYQKRITANRAEIKLIRKQIRDEKNR